MKIYVVEEDANSSYGMTRIVKLFLKKEDAEEYKKEIDSKQIEEYKEAQKTYPERFDEFQERIQNVNEVWITEYNAT